MYACAYLLPLCTQYVCTYGTCTYFLFSHSDSVLNEIGVDLDDHGAIVPPHLAKGLEAE